MMRIVLISEVFVPAMGYLENMLPKYLARLGAKVDVVASALSPNHRLDREEETYGGFVRGAPGGSTDASESGDAIESKDATDVRNALETQNAIAARDGFRLHVLPHTRTFGHIRLLGLREKLRELRPHIVQTMTPIGWIALASAANRLGCGYRLFSGCHYHASVFALARGDASWASPRRLRCFLERGLHGRVLSWWTEKYYAISPDCARVAERFFGVPTSKIETSPLGVDTEVFYPVQSASDANARTEWRRRLGFLESEIVCVYSGRFTKDKNPLLLADAITELVAAGEPYRGLFIGHGPQAAEIESRAGCVTRPFMPMSELGAFYRSADIGVWPTQESMSMLDALACGLPLVANDTMNAPERLEGTGFAYRENDRAGLVGALRRLREGELRRGLGARGAARMREHYSWEQVAARRIQDYSAALEKNRSRAIGLPLALPLRSGEDAGNRRLSDSTWQER
jgi:glycosyltransferase involved in cell wall biosynthesis